MTAERTRRGRRSRTLYTIADEAVASILQRPARTMLSTIGAGIGVASFVATLGITATSNGQISGQFDALESTQVSVLAPEAGPGQFHFVQEPERVERAAKAIHGARLAGVHAVFRAGARASRFPQAVRPVSTESVSIEGISPGLPDAVGLRLSFGRAFNRFTSHEPVALIGQGLARNLGIGPLSENPSIYLNGSRFTVLGVTSSATRAPQVADSVLIPMHVAQRVFGNNPVSPPQLLVITNRGAAAVVAKQIPLALDPQHPELYVASGPETPHKLANQVSASLRSLLIGLACLTLLVGAVGVANSSFISVLERVSEIGLRRCLGARPWQVSAQFLIESGTIGLMGGAGGTAVGVAVVLVVAALNDWSAVAPPAALAAGPLLGLLVGLIAGAYPAGRAARIEPADALRR